MTAAAVESVARDYIEGWFAADASRMEAALHPQLVKRAVGEDGLWTLTRDEMVAATAGGGGRADAAAQVIVIDDIRVDGDIASVRVRSTAYIDFLHLTREAGSWRIVNAVRRSR
jgi:hypothetical protein